MTPEQSNIASTAISGGSSLLGSVISGAFNARENRKAFERQRQLAHEQYENYLNYSRVAGATPASIAQGITHSGGLSAPGASTGGNPMPDLGSSLASGISAGASQRQASASTITANSERDVNLMRLTFEPKKYYADVANALSETFRNYKQAFYYGSLKENYDELNKDLRLIRPYNIAKAKQGLLNQLQEYENLIAENGRIKSESYRNYQQGYEARTQGELNTQLRDESAQRTFNLQLDQFRKQWELDLLAIGIDPNKPFWENTARLMYSNPEMFKKRMDMLVQTLNIIDGKLQDNLGEHYKRNAAILGGLYYLDQRHQKRANNRAFRFNAICSAISSFIPFAGGRPNPVLGFSNRGLY